MAKQIQYYKGALAEAGHEYEQDRVVVARAMYTAPTLPQSRQDTEAPFMWFKETGQEVGAPRDNNVELLPEEYRAYRGRFGSGYHLRLQRHVRERHAVRHAR